MATEFKQQQHDRIEEGKELMREDEMRDLSKIPTKQIPGNQSLLSKISEGISNVASTISEKVGLAEPPVEGHEDLDQKTRKQVKKLNKEVLEQAHEKGIGIEQPNDWENALPKHEVKKEVEQVKEEVAEKTSFVGKVKEGVQNLFAGHKKEEKNDDGTKHSEWENPLPKHEIKEEAEQAKEKAGEVADKAKESVKSADKTSIVEKVREGVQGLSESISQGAGNLKERFAKKEENRDEDGTKHYKTVKDGINEKVDDLKHEQRVAELGQEELSSQNPFQPLTSGNNEEGENRTLGEKIKGGLNDASQKISSTIGGATQKVKSTFVHKEAGAQDKENAQQIA